MAVGPVSSERLKALVAAARSRMGQTAHMATGADVPRAVAPPLAGPARAAVAAPAPAAPVVLSQQQVKALVRKAINEGPDSLTPEEVAALRSTPGVQEEFDAATSAEIPDAPPVEAMDAEAPSAPRPFAQQGKQLVGDDGSPVKRLDDERFVYDDGTIVDVDGNVLGRQAPSDLTTTGGTDTVDNTAQSAVDLGSDGGKNNLTPKAKKVDKTAELGGTIYQATTPSDLESHSQATAKRLLRAAQQHRVEGGYSPEFLAAISRDPEEAAARLARLEELAGLSNVDRAAEQIDTAAQARAVAATPRGTPADRTASQQDFGAARALVAETLPEGDLAGLLEAYSRLDPERRRQVLEALPEDAGRFIDSLLDPNSDDFSVLPNAVALATRPIDVPAAGGATAARSVPRGNPEQAQSLIELAASRVAAQKRSSMMSFSDEIEAARGDKERIAELLTQREQAAQEFDAILSSRERLAAIAKQSAEDEALSAMVALEEGANAADASGDAARAAELRRKIGLVEGQNAERMASFDAMLDPASVTTDPGASDAVTAAREYNTRLQSATALRNAILGTDPLVSEEQTRMLRAAANPAPRPNVTPGARTPEFAAEEVTEAEMPTAFDEALAAGREADLAREKRAPGGGLSEEARKAAVGVEEARDLPLFLRGRDRNDPLESRARGDRSLEGNDLKAIEKVRKLQDEIDAAAEAMKTAEGAEALARAQQRYAKALKAMDSAYPGGRKAMPDSRLNKAGQQETYDDAVMTLAGFRPRPKNRLARSSADMEGDDAASLVAEGGRVFGDDVDGMLDGEFDDWSVSPFDVESNGPQKKGRLGGNQQPSRIMGAIDFGFGGTNPFALKNADGSPAFASAEDVAEEVLARNTVFKPGTANYDMARDRIARIVSEHFQPTNPKSVETITAAPGEAPAVSSRPTPTDLQPAEGSLAGYQPPDDGTDAALDASAVDLSESPAVEGTEAGKPAAKGRASRKKKPAADAESPPVEGGAAADGSPPVEATGARVRTVDEIQSEADEVFQEALRAAKDEGLKGKQATAQANAARKKFVDEQMAALRAGGTASPPVEGTTPGTAPKPKPDASPPVEGAAAADAPAADAPPKSPPVEGDEAPKPDDSPKVEGDTPAAPDGDTKPKPKPTPPPPPKQRIPTWLKRSALVGGVVGTGLALSRFSGDGGGGISGDIIPMPEGAGGGSGGGEFVPIPVGSDSAGLLDAAAAAAAEEDRLTRALERIRGRSPQNRIPTSQTIQNYNAGWR